MKLWIISIYVVSCIYLFHIQGLDLSNPMEPINYEGIYPGLNPALTQVIYDPILLILISLSYIENWSYAVLTF